VFLSTGKRCPFSRFLVRVFNAIDFWTTKCTNCPDALDKLDVMASDPKFSNVRFVSICCDKLDGAREILEKEEEPRWTHISHYFMEHSHKEEAKKMLGFQSVPFYVLLNDTGEVVHKGSSKTFDFEEIPGIHRSEANKENEEEVTATLEKDVDTSIIPSAKPSVERVFILDEDF
jgi:thiol-disulfide isomerase/thioredoxin